MQTLILVIIGVVTSSDFVIESLELPSITRFLPELLSGIVIVYVLIAGTRDRFRLVSPKYWLFFAALAIVTFCGIIINNPGPGPVISGLRLSFRAAPLFLLPAVLPISGDQLQRQLKLLLVMAFVQFPIAAYQRWVLYTEDRYSGDPVQGTLMDSGILSMFLICAVLVLTGLLLKRRIGKFLYATLFLILLFPTTINETKATVIFLPLGLFVTLLVGAEAGKRLRYAGIGLALLVIFGAIFIPVYNMTQQHNHYKVDIVDFFTKEQELDKYLVGKGPAGLGARRPALRGEAMAIPIKYLSRDPAMLAFGLGIGNVSPSTIGKNFQGAYYDLFQNVLLISFAYFFLEFGLLGVILFGLLFWMVFSDSVAVARSDKGLTGAMAAGWTGVVSVFMLAMFYTSYHYFASVTFLYWYLSGVVCARRMSLALETERVSHPVAHRQPSAIG